MLNNLTIKAKLLVLAGLVTLSFVFILIMENKAINDLKEISKMDHGVEELNIHMLILRKHEKDFLARKDVKYLASFDKTIKQIEEISKELKVGLLYFYVDTNSLNNYNKIVHEYSAIFKKLVQTQQTIGLNPKDGLYGELRSKVQQVQDYAKKSNDKNLLANIYDLRKQEKDFMLRYDKKYLKSFNSKIDKILVNEKYEQMHSLLNLYKKSFTTLVSLEEEKGLSSKVGLMGKMRKTIQASTVSLKKLTKQIVKVDHEKSKEISMFSLIITVICAVLVVFSLLYISRTITISLRDFEKGLIQFFSFVNNETQDVEMLNDKNSDEIGNMAKIINQSISNTKVNIEKDRALIDDATAVANKIKVGHLSNRITKESNSQELNDLKNVINEMLENLNNNINNIMNVLSKYASYDYLSNVDSSGVEGSILKLCTDVNSLGSATTKMLCNNKSIIDEKIKNLEPKPNNINQTAEAIKQPSKKNSLSSSIVKLAPMPPIRRTVSK